MQIGWPQSNNFNYFDTAYYTIIHKDIGKCLWSEKEDMTSKVFSPKATDHTEVFKVVGGEVVWLVLILVASVIECNRVVASIISFCIITFLRSVNKYLTSIKRNLQGLAECSVSTVWRGVFPMGTLIS